ncbi:MAG: NAD(P)H-dependent glycerol-3-phosphate dehydrogenase [Thermoleophilia bacterium]
MGGITIPDSGAKAAVIGGGSWGTAVARLMINAGIITELVCRQPAQAEAINQAHKNPSYLKDIKLPMELVASTYDDNSIRLADLVVMAVPSRAFREVIQRFAREIRPEAPVVSLAKGLEPETYKRMSQVLAAELPAPAAGRIAVLSGPNHAEEVARDIPSATTIAAADADLARSIQRLFSTPSFRVYVNSDVVGVELCGATKNVIALAAGMSDGLGFGDNTKASLITRGLAEMARLGEKEGGDPRTFSGLAGMGDLIATCTSRHSRNRLAGELIAQGKTAAEAEAEMGMVAEGLTSARSVLELGWKHELEMPITEQVCEVIYEGKNVLLAVAELMGREPKEE